MKSFRDLKVWQKSHALTLKKVYKVSTLLPREEQYGITSQIRRAAVSIPANIAEGCGRNTDNELARFLEIAMGSASELEYLVMLLQDLNYLTSQSINGIDAEITEVKRMLASFIVKLRADR
ncbi:MAG: four helix bundle protein [Gammaproteobacteria bacterium]|nr:four helix bundle protein [Gammaproteobacteria bacterium]